MKRPLTGLVLVYALGIWLGSILLWPFPLLWFGAAALLVTYFVLRRTRFAFGLLLALIGTAGILAYRLSTTNFSPRHITRLLELRDQNATLRGTIVTDTGYRDRAPAKDERHNFKLQLDAIGSEGQWRTAEGCIMVFISDTRQQEPLRYGDVIECSAVLRVPPPAQIGRAHV